VKRFAFRLERLRELRERAEREQAAVLGAAMRTEHERQGALERARAAAERARTGASAVAMAAPQLAGLLQNLDFAHGMASERVDAAAAELSAATEQVDEQRTLYGEKRRDLRVIEKLKERRLDAWREDSAREEQKETDGVARGRTSKGERT
jgi:flagellar FliJ protein